MLLNTHSYRKAEVAEEPHNLLVDFHPEPLFKGQDRSFSNLYCGLPHPLGEPLDIPPELALRAKHCVTPKGQAKKLLDSVETINIENSTYKYMPMNLLKLYHDFSSEEHGVQDGNLLDIVKLGDSDYLIWPLFDGRVKLMNTTNSNDTFTLLKQFESRITLIKCYHINGDPYVLVRLLYSRVVLFTVVLLPDLSEIFAFNCDDIVDVSLHPQNSDHLVLATTNNLKVQDITSNQVIFSLDERDIIQCDLINNTQLLVLQKFEVKLFNYSTGELLRTLDPQLIKCNQMYSYKLLNESLLLISQHYVIKTDFNNFESVKTYSHTLNYPVFADAVICDTECYLCLANSEDSDKVIFGGSVAFGLPVKAPDLKTTLQEAFLKEPSLSLKENLDKRLSFATTGLKTCQSDDNVFIYTVNSVGDIFRQVVSPKAINHKHSIERICEWIENLCSTPPTLYVTHFAQMDKAFLLLKQALTEKHPVEEENAIVESQTIKFLEKFKPIYSKNNITSTFGRAFLEIWESSDESDEEGFPDQNEDDLPFYDKVSDWFGKTVDPEEGVIDEDFDEM